MKKIFNRFIPIVLSTILLVGCVEQLDVDTYNNITGASFWNSSGDAETYAIGLHDDVANNLHGSNNFISNTDGRTDMFQPGALGPRLTGRVELHTQTALSGGGNWSGFYNTIHHCNLLLQKVEEIAFDDEAQKAEIAATAYFFRAFTYFDLVRIYGDIPLVLEPTLGKPELENYFARSPKSEILALIKADVDKAVAGLPTGIANKNFISKAAALALKAEVYMWTAKALTARNSPVTGDLNTAVSAIDAIPDASGGKVSFVTGNWKSIFARQANSSPEYIWATYYDYIVGPSNNVHNAITLRIDNVPVEMQGTFPIAVTDEGLNRIMVGDLMNTLYKKHETIDAHDNPFDKTDDAGPFYDKRDLRYINSMVDLYDDGTTNVSIKFPGILVPADNNRYWDNDLPIYRWTGMLLLKAEAMNTLGGQSAAVVDILNMTRTRAGLANYSGATDQTTLEIEILRCLLN